MALPQVQDSTPKYHSWNWIAVFVRKTVGRAKNFISSVRGPRYSGVAREHALNRAGTENAVFFREPVSRSRSPASSTAS